MSEYEFAVLIRCLSLLKGRKRDKAVDMASLEIQWAYDDWATQTIDKASQCVAAHGMPDDRCWLRLTRRDGFKSGEHSVLFLF